MAWEHLSVDDQGVRPGHPVSGRTPARTSIARDRLITSTNTVRQMIAEGALQGYWRRTGTRMTFYVYAEDVEEYLHNHGPLNRRRRRYGTGNLSELRASLAALTSRVSALEEEVRENRRSNEDRAAQHSDIDWERRRRFELEDALAALEEDDSLVAEADALNQQAYAKLRDAHRQLRASIARVRQPRTIADLPGVSDSSAAGEV